jgi:hypothetical protein
MAGSLGAWALLGLAGAQRHNDDPASAWPAVSSSGGLPLGLPAPPLYVLAATELSRPSRPSPAAL